MDLLLAAAMVACGLRPALYPPNSLALPGATKGVMPGVPALEGTEFHRASSPETLQALHDQGLLLPICWRRPWCLVNTAGALLQCGLCWVQPGRGPSPLLGLCQGLGIDGPHYPVAYFFVLNFK